MPRRQRDATPRNWRPLATGKTNGTSTRRASLQNKLEGNVEANLEELVQPARLTGVKERAKLTEHLNWLVPAVGCLIFSLIITFTSSPGAFIVDYRFEVGWSPDQTLQRGLSAWDDRVGLGRVAGLDRSPLPALMFWITRSLGAAPWVAQRLWHVALLTMAGSGAIAVLRRWKPELSIAHSLAALFYMVGPPAVNLFLPSPIFLAYAVAPWMMVAVMRGGSGERPWRWAAVFALCVLAAAPNEVPATVYNTAWCLPVAVFGLVISRRSTLASLGGFFVRAAALTAGALAFLILRLGLSQQDLQSRIATTESPAAVATTTTWSESLRGVGHWLTYVNIGTAPRPQLAQLTEGPWVVAASALIPLVALIGLAMGRDRQRLLFGFLVLWGTTIVVGINSVSGVSPWGRVVQQLFDSIPGTVAFRSTTKASSAVALGVAILFGVSVWRAGERVGGSSWRKRLATSGVTTASLLIVGSVAWPALSGQLYNPEAGITDVPDYWLEAADWLNAKPDDPAIMVLPGTTNTHYAWGRLSDDVFEALVEPRVYRANVFSAGEATAANALLATNDRLMDAQLAEHSIVPALRRLGVDYVLLRNDLAWRDRELSRPAAADPLRDDPGLELVAAFGEVGQNTVDLTNGLAAAELEQYLQDIEQELHPVEVLRVVHESLPRVSSDDMLVVEGDGGAWTLIDGAASGLEARPIRYAAQLSTVERQSALRAGATVVITDTNTRSVRQVNGSSALLLPPSPEEVNDATSGPVPNSLFADPASQTVLWQPGIDGLATTVGAESIRSWVGPQRVFDGQPTTGWRSATLSDPINASVSATFTSPVDVGAVTVRVAKAPGLIGVREITVTLDADTAESRTKVGVVGADSVAEVVFDDGRLAQTLTVAVTAHNGGEFGSVGINEVTINDLDLRPARQLPVDLLTDPNISSDLAQAPVVYLFERDVPNFPSEVESSLRRRFLVDSPRSFTLVAELASAQPVAVVDEQNHAAACNAITLLNGAPVLMRPAPGAVNESGEAAKFVSCDPIELAPGWHLVEDNLGGSGVPANRFELTTFDELFSTAAVTARSQFPNTATVLERTRTFLRIETNADDAGILLTGISYHSGWNATVDGAEVTSTEVDAQLALAVPAGAHTIEFVFGPQRAFGIAWLITGVTVLVCLAIVLTPATRPDRGQAETKPTA